MNATIRDVAKKAGVSVGTVSRVLNGHSAVSTESRDRVYAVVSDLNYSPLRKRHNKHVGSSASRLEGKNIGIVLLGMDRTLSSLPVVAAGLHGAVTALTDHGATVTLMDLPQLDRVPAQLTQWAVDGVLLKGSLQGNLVDAANPKLLDTFRALPCVWFLHRPAGCWGDSVASDDIVIGKIAADHLIDRGHRHLAFLNPKTDQLAFTRRLMSFKWHAEAREASVGICCANFSNPQSFPSESPNSIESVQELVDDLLDSHPNVTAIFVPSDSIAVLVYRALGVRGVRIPEDISVVSCNHEKRLIDGLRPSLTSIDIHPEAIGRAAIDQLALAIETPRRKLSVEVTIEPTLMEGDSVLTLS